MYAERPVPAGICLPTITLDLRSSRWSTSPSIAAEVRTPAVRMNDALESQESIELATFSVPRIAGSASGGVPPARAMFWTVYAKT